MKKYRILLFVTGILMLPVGAVITWNSALHLSGQMAGSTSAFRFSQALHAVSFLLQLTLGLALLRQSYLILMGNASPRTDASGLKSGLRLVCLTIVACITELIRVIDAGGNISLFMIITAAEVLLAASAYYLKKFLILSSRRRG